MIDTEVINVVPKSKQLQVAKIDFDNFVNDNLPNMIKVLSRYAGINSNIFYDDLALTSREGKFNIVFNPKPDTPVIALKSNNLRGIKRNNLTITGWGKKILHNYQTWLKRTLSAQQAMNALELNKLLAKQPKQAAFSQKAYADYILANLGTPIAELTNIDVTNVNFKHLSDVNITYLAHDHGYFGQLLVTNWNNQQPITTSMVNNIIDYFTESDYFKKQIPERQRTILLLVDKLNLYPESIINDGQAINTYSKIIRLTIEGSQLADFHRHVVIPLDVLGKLIGEMSIDNTLNDLGNYSRADIIFKVSSKLAIDHFMINILNDYHSVDFKNAILLLNRMHEHSVRFDLANYKKDFVVKSQTISKYFDDIYDLKQFNQLLQTIISLAK